MFILFIISMLCSIEIGGISIYVTSMNVTKMNDILWLNINKVQSILQLKNPCKITGV